MSGTPVARMRRTWERVRTVPGLGKDVTALALALALALLVGGYILSQQRVAWPWQQWFTFAADFGAAPGIAPGQGQEVRIAGVPVGEVRKAEVSDDGHARLTMAIEPGHRIYDNARLVLRPKNPLNEMYIEVNPGGPPGRPLQQDQVLPVNRTANPVQVDEVLQHLDDRVRAAATSLLGEADVALAGAPEHLADGLRATNNTLTDWQPVAEALQNRRAKIRELVTALSQVAGAIGGDDERLGRLAASTQQTLQVLARRDQELSATLAQLPGFAGELRRSTAGIQQLSGQLDPTLDNVRRAADDLPKALSRLTKTVDAVGETVTTARPVVAAARPVVADLRPLVADANAALGDVQAITKRLDPVTAALLPYLTDLQAFVYNTASVTSLEDANGGLIRALFVGSPETLPLKSR